MGDLATLSRRSMGTIQDLEQSHESAILYESPRSKPLASPMGTIFNAIQLLMYLSTSQDSLMSMQMLSLEEKIMLLI